MGLPRFLLPGLVIALAHCAGGNEQPPNVPDPHPSTSATVTKTATPPVASSAPEITAKKPVATTYHGTTVTDDYQWLEDPKDPAVEKWSDEQNARSRKHIDGYADRKAVHARVSKLLSASSADRFAVRWQAKTLFALEDRPPKQQPFLVTFSSPENEKSARVVLDPNVLDAKGATAIDWYVPSRDGKLVAISLSKGGSESGTVHVYEVATGKEREVDTIARVNGGTAGGSVAWNADNSGFFYTRYPREGERKKEDLDFFQQIWFHKLGTKDTEDVYSLGKDFPRIAEVELETSDDGKWLHSRVANGDGGEYAHYLLSLADKKATWKQLAVYADKITEASFGRDGNLWMRSLKDAPKGKILKLSPQVGDLAKAKLVVPESSVVIQHFAITKSRLYLVDLVGGPSQIRALDHEGKAAFEVPILPVSQVAQIEALDGDDVLFRNQSFLEPPAWYRYDSKTKKTVKSALFKTAPADFADAEVVRDTCTSKDGTKVPINILRKKGIAFDSNNITLLNAYGGYGVSLAPRFNVIHRVWLDQGGVFALANLRGGGEFGEEWHLAGNLTKKQNVFDDFIACAQFLVDKKYTRPEKLAIIGGSNGGLLMGAAMTQRPDLFSAVVSKVGIYDMLRVELTPNGAFNVTEFGTVKDAALFQALYAYSPYHRVKEGSKYPAVLFMTGKNDPRVDPWHSRKMVARLLAANPSGRPVLLRTSGDTGHGMGTPLSEEIDQEADVYSFLFHELGHALK